jgi:hypothetical protein
VQLGIADIEEYLALKYSEDQPRDSGGRFTSSGGGDVSRVAEAPVRSELSPHTGMPIRPDLPSENVRAFGVGERVIFGDRLNPAYSRAGAVAEAAPLMKRELAVDLAKRTKDIPIEQLRLAVPDLARAYEYDRPPDGYRLVRYDDRLILAAPNAFYDPPGSRAIPLTDEDAVREYVMSQIVDSWAKTANDNNAQALAIQERARDVFGVKDAASWDVRPTTEREVSADLDKNGPLYDRVLREMYATTQERFKEQGITEMQLYRGFNYSVLNPDRPTPSWLNNAVTLQADMPGGRQPVSIQQVPLRPLSSFSSDYDSAKKFSNPGTGGAQAVIGGVVPVERILSMPGTGFGAAREYEFVVIGGTEPFTVQATNERR